MQTDAPLEIFFSYAHKDIDLMDEVRRQLIVYERNGKILKWHDRQIPPGSEWRKQIDSRLNAAQIVLMFMSPHFIESRYCYEIEGALALQRHGEGLARVIPVILRPCPWEETPFGELQALPTDGKPISTWENRDLASLDAAKGVMRAVDDLMSARNKVRERERPSPANATSGPVLSKRVGVIYCGRCGQLAGQRSACTGPYTSHEFTSGSANDYCLQCGVCTGTQTTCTGHLTAHQFARARERPVMCSRCGVHPGQQTTCVGAHTHHAFVDM